MGEEAFDEVESLEVVMGAGFWLVLWALMDFLGMWARDAMGEEAFDGVESSCVGRFRTIVWIFSTSGTWET